MEGANNSSKNKKERNFLFLFIFLTVLVFAFLSIYIEAVREKIEEDYRAAEEGWASSEQPRRSQEWVPEEYQGQQRTFKFCAVKIWNIVPPETPHEELKSSVKKRLQDLKVEIVENNLSLEKECGKLEKELEVEERMYPVVYLFEKTYYGDLAPSSNGPLVEGKKILNRLSVGEYGVIPIYDGPYLSDGIDENDFTYISDYSLVERIK